MGKQEYISPEMEIIELDSEDVIVTSCTGYDTSIICPMNEENQG